MTFKERRAFLSEYSIFPRGIPNAAFGARLLSLGGAQNLLGSVCPVVLFLVSPSVLIYDFPFSNFSPHEHTLFEDYKEEPHLIMIVSLYFS